jgi:hypothetical protein
MQRARRMIMKFERMRVLAPALAAFLAVATSAAGNLLLNPGFDEPKSAEPPECDQADAWERYGSWANRHASQSGWEARSGTASVAYHHNQSDSVNAGWFQDVTGLKPGVPYTFSVWALWSPDCNAARINVKFEKYGGGGPDYVVRKYAHTDMGGDWTRIQVQATLPQGVTETRVTIECIHGFGGNCATATGNIRFDDASLIAEGVASPSPEPAASPAPVPVDAPASAPASEPAK